MDKEVIPSFRIVFRNYDAMLLTNVMHPHLKALVNQEEAIWNTVSYSVRSDSYARLESKKSLGKYIKYHAAPYHFEIIINLAMLNALLLKRSVAPGCVISILTRKA